MQIDIVRSGMAQGVALEAGNSYDIPDEVAQQLITLGRAVVATAKPAAKAKKASKAKRDDA